MQNPRFIDHRAFRLSLISILFLSACSAFEGEDFTFSAPSGFTNKTFEQTYIDKTYDAEYLLYSYQGHMYFQILREKIPPNSSLDNLFTAYLTKTQNISSHYQFISQNTMEKENRNGIEYVHREFSGEPYVQIREIWLEYKDWAYILVCSDAVDSTPGAVIPVAAECSQLLQGFKFK